MDISNIANTPIDLKIDGQVYKVSRLSISELFTTFQKEAKESYIEDIKSVASTISDKNERLEFLGKQIRELPKGKALEDMASERMNSTEGGIKLLEIILNKHQKVSKDDIYKLASNNKNASDISAIIQYATATTESDEKKV